MSKQYFVYMMMNFTNTVIYTGITNDLIRRAYEHRNGTSDGFTRKYHAIKLVYYEEYSCPSGAIAREKQIKAGSRAKKFELIQRVNPRFEDLYQQIIG